MMLFQLILFMSLLVMVGLWFVCLARLSRMLRDRHPAKYDEMELAHMWPENLAGWLRGFDNSGPVKAVLRFLWRREYFRMRDDAVARLGGFMRGLFAAYVVVFVVFGGAIVRDSLQAEETRQAARRTPVTDDRRDRVHELHYQKRWPEALALYDELLGEAGADAELVYWRGVARWSAGRYDEALVDFRRVMDLQPGNFDAYRNADSILSMQRRFDDCVDVWSRYLRVLPGDPEAHHRRGGAHFHRGDFAAAHADAKRACELGKAEACSWAKRLELKL